MHWKRVSWRCGCQLSLHYWNGIIFFSLAAFSSRSRCVSVYVMISHIAVCRWMMVVVSDCQQFHALNGKRNPIPLFSIFRIHWHVKYDFSHICARARCGVIWRRRWEEICHLQFQTEIIQKRMRYHKPIIIITGARFTAATRTRKRIDRRYRRPKKMKLTVPDAPHALWYFDGSRSSTRHDKRQCVARTFQRRSYAPGVIKRANLWANIFQFVR